MSVLNVLEVGGKPEKFLSINITRYAWKKNSHDRAESERFSLKQDAITQ